MGPELIDHRTYGFVSDGDVMEGVAMEATSLAGHLGLGKLIYLYDDNDITLAGPKAWWSAIAISVRLFSRISF